MISVEEGIALIRERLREPKRVVRLVGISGMGKTRLAQALFDQRTGSNALPRDLAIYCDVGLSPGVSPMEMATSLAHNHAAAVMVVDNCPGDLHRALEAICASPGAKHSLLTIDFDIGADSFPATKVFAMQRAGDGLIWSLLGERAAHLSYSDRGRVVEFADGNARIALALAAAVTTSGTLATLDDTQLLDRLFLTQRREPDPDLRKVARVASLCYAFVVDGGEAGELSFLASLAGVSPETFHGKIADLLERGLAQQRGNQRAILPTAIATRLAQEALARLTSDQKRRLFSEDAAVRLQYSFARQLGLLHGCSEAQALAAELLAEEGRFGAPNDDHGQEMRAVRNLAPLQPVLALEVAERKVKQQTAAGCKTDYAGMGWLQPLLVALAYDPGTFPRAARCLASLAAVEDRRPFDQASGNFGHLFLVAGSGTMATPDQRFSFMDELLASKSEYERKLGLLALGSALQTHFFGVDGGPDFGGRPRGASWSPSSSDELLQWFNAGLDRIKALTLVAAERQHAHELFCQKFFDLARCSDVQPLAIRTMKELCGDVFWPEGWFAVCKTLHRATDEVRTEELLALERTMAPSTLQQRFDCWCRHETYAWHDPHGPTEESWATANASAVAVGRECATDAAGDGYVQIALSDPEVRGYHFGLGYASGISDVEWGWSQLLARARKLDGAANWTMIGGYLSFAKEAGHDVDAWLDAVSTDASLSDCLIPLNVSGEPLSKRAIQRLISVIRAGNYTNLSLAHLNRVRFDASTPTRLVVEFVECLCDVSQHWLAASVLDLDHLPDGASLDPDLIGATRRLLCEIPLTAGDPLMVDHMLSRMANLALGPGGEDSARTLSRRLRDSLLDEAQREALRLPQLAKSIMATYPRAILESFLEDDVARASYRAGYFLVEGDDDDNHRDNAFWAAPQAALIEWVLEDQATRAVQLAKRVPYFKPGADGFAWTQIAEALIALPGTEAEVLNAFEDRFPFGSWSGSHASRYLRRRPLVQHYIQSPRGAVSEWASRALKDVDLQIELRSQMDRPRAEAFE